MGNKERNIQLRNPRCLQAQSLLEQRGFFVDVWGYYAKGYARRSRAISKHAFASVLYAAILRRGKTKWLKWFFYIYYPTHLIILGILRIYMYGTGVGLLF